MPDNNTAVSIQAISISKLMPNEDQPRHRFKPGSIRELADSLLAIGQQTPLKVRALTTEEKASYRKSDAEWFGEGSPYLKTMSEHGFEYMVIGGHRRLEAAQLAGMTTLDCLVLDIKPEDTLLACIMDNNLEEMDWWDWILAIEAEHKAFPDMNQRDLAKRLGVSKSKVNNALILANVLNEDSREMIDRNLDPECDSNGNIIHSRKKDYDAEDNLVQPLDKTSPSGTNLVQPLDKTRPEYRIKITTLLALAVLEEPDLIEYTLMDIFDNEMTDDQIKRLIQWLNDGNYLEDFDLKKAPKQDKPKEIDPLAEAWKGLGPQIKVKYKGGEDYEIRINVTGGQKALKTAQAAQKALQGGILTAILNA